MAPRTMMPVWVVVVALCLAPCALSWMPQDDEAPDEIVVVKAGHVITVSGEDLQDATIVIRNGKIEAVGTNVEFPFGGRVVEVPGLTVMPGMIHPCSRLGVPKGGSGIRPDTVLTPEFFTNPSTYEKVLASGFTTLGLVPAGQTMPGRTLVIRTWGESPSDLPLHDKGPIAINFNSPGSAKAQVMGAFKKAQAEIDKIKKAREEWDKKQKAAAEAQKKKPAAKPEKAPEKKEEKAPVKKEEKKAPAKKPAAPKAPAKFVPPKINPVYQPLVDLIEKKKDVVALVEMGASGYSPFGSRTMMGGGAVLQWEPVIEKYGIAHGYRFHNPVTGKNSPFMVRPETDLELAADWLGKQKSLTALFPLVNHHKFTRNKYNLGLALRNAGCQVVYIPQSESWTNFARMRERLAIMVRNGFPRSEILRTVTMHPAKMLGLEGRLGSIQKGRDANLVFLDGDPLGMSTKVVKVMVEGRMVPVKRLVY